MFGTRIYGVGSRYAGHCTATTAPKLTVNGEAALIVDFRSVYRLNSGSHGVNPGAHAKVVQALVLLANS